MNCMRSHIRILCVLLAASLLFSACTVSAGQWSAAEAAAAAAASQKDLSSLETLTESSTRFAQTASRIYGLDPDAIEEAVIQYAGGTEAHEIIVLRCRSQADAAEAASALESYADAREAAFTGYAPDQAQEVGAREILQEGTLVMLLIVPDPQAALAALNARRKQTAAPGSSAAVVLPSVASETEAAQEIYDHDAVLAAVRSGDTSGLSEANRQVAERIIDAIASETDPSMSDYEKEKAVHDWIIRNVEYDPAAMEHPLTLADPIENHDNPIGALVGGGAICYGYSSTFQLMMDALGIPCITVEGAAYDEDRSHSWNLVQLGGQWYYVDVTWDDPLSGMPSYTYFNVTAEKMRENGPHIWDASALPETAAKPYMPPG